MTIDEYLEECRRIAGDRWEECREAYSFEEAKRKGMSPVKAVRDCIDWLDA